jgi:hypothetical protein
MNDRIKVVDSFPGSGKTSAMIQIINKMDEDTKVIYITPFLSEVDRIIKNCPNKEFVQPSAYSGKGSKLNHLIKLILEGKNIVSTHALFMRITDELINSLKMHNYVLILDEVMNVVQQYDLYEDYRGLNGEDKEIKTKQDIKSLIEKKYIRVNEDYSVDWIEEKDMLGKYETLKEIIDRGLLYFVRDSLLIWSFPVEVFKEGIFDEIYILTYQFEYQIQHYYYKFYGLEYANYKVKHQESQYELYNNDNNIQEDLKWKITIKNLINIVDNSKLNKIGSYYSDAYNRTQKSSLSKTWYSNNMNLIQGLQNNMTNFFRHITNSKTEKRMWTCFKDHKKIFTNKNISKKQWVELNSRATNEYIEKNVLAYMINRYPNAFFESFFDIRGIKIDRDKYALSELIQWIFRSAIRDNQPIDLYIPSERMRNLLLDWLNNKIE